MQLIAGYFDLLQNAVKTKETKVQDWEKDH
jgi:hypothetical protein